VKYLFDINALLALAHQNHADHQKAGLWFQSVAPVAVKFFTCSITELGFVRVSVQAGLEPDVGSAQRTLAAFKQSSSPTFELCTDAIGVAVMPKHVKSPAQLTDGHLLELANSVGARLVTLDRGIPGTLVIN
jgi:predicted nucleic acid-binding protein